MRDPDITLSAGPTWATPRGACRSGEADHLPRPCLHRALPPHRAKGSRAPTDHERHPAHAGEAVLGLEAAARGLVQPNAALNLVSGVFGKGMGYWLKDFGSRCTSSRSPTTTRSTRPMSSGISTSTPEIELLTVVHSETPSGTLHDVAAIGPIAVPRRADDRRLRLLARRHRVPHGDWQIDIAVAAAQKCLGGPPGITLMSVSDAAWERIRANPSAPRASFLSMLDWKEQWIDGEKFPFTPSVVDMHGIEACVDVVLGEGLEASIARHDLCARACRAGGPRRGAGALAAQQEVGGLRHGDCGARRLTDIQVRAHCRSATA